MKAVITTKYGPPEVLQLQEVDEPIPKAKEVLIKIHATTVTAGDCEMRRFDVPGWLRLPLRLFMGVTKPRIKILGQEFSGEVIALGRDVSQYKVGDAIFGGTDMRLGAHAEYLCLKASHPITTKPASLSHEQAATLPTGGLNALCFLRKANIQPGEKLLINGAGGSIGTYAIQLAKVYGAEVTAVDTEEKLEVLDSIGADHVIDYTKQDFSQNGETYDAIIDIVGKQSFTWYTKSLKPKGRFVIGNPHSFFEILRSIWVSKRSDKQIIVALAAYKKEDLDYLKGLVETGKLKSVIDKTYPLEQIVEAHRYVETGHKTGNLVVCIKEKL